jgi:hypothetical protein
MAPPSTTELGQGYAEARARGVGIDPGAHPEFDKPTPLEKVGEALKRLFKPKPVGNSSADRHAQRAYEFEKNNRR